jgi:hypothetical protein
MPKYAGPRPFDVGQRVEIPVHYDLWMQGAQYGRIVSYHEGEHAQSDFVKVRMEHPQVKTLLKVWRIDWQYMMPR